MAQETWLQRLKNGAYDAVLRLAKLEPAPVRPKTLLLVRPNNIGDYVLWRTLLPGFRASERFRDHRITLLGNSAWKGLFEALDRKHVDDVLWVDPNRFKKDLRYRLGLLRTVRQAGYETVVNTLSSRCKRVDDAFVLACPSQTHRIGQLSDGTNVFPSERGYDRGLYGELFRDVRPFEFEYDRSARFTAAVTGLPEGEQALPDFPVAPYRPGSVGDRPYFLVFPGSSNPWRIWQGAHFAAVMQEVAQRWGLLPVLAGGPGDAGYAAEILKHYTGPVVDLCGQTSLVQLGGLTKEARFLLGIDTGGVHIAAVAGCPVFGLYNGSHYGRYNPYPARINPAVTGIYPPAVADELRQRPIPEKYLYHQDIDYNTISPRQVCDAIHAFLARTSRP